MVEGDQVDTPEGARELIGRLYLSHGAQLQAFLERALGRKALAEEVAQETYLKFYRLSRPEEVACPKALLFDIATKIAYSRIRRIQAEAMVVKAIATPTDAAEAEQVPYGEQFGPDRQAASEQSLQWLAQIVEHLPDGLRQALTLHHIEQLSYREIGLRLGITAKAAEKRVSRAVIHSRRWLSARGLLWLGPD